MLNFYITAVKYDYLTIDKVPSVFQYQVKDALGLTQQEAPTEPESTDTQTTTETTDQTSEQTDTVNTAPAE